jgi:hypothetical protein
MSMISRHIVGTAGGTTGLLDWVAQHKHRNYADFGCEDQLKQAMAIARIEDGEARKLCLRLLEKAARLNAVTSEMHREFDTLYGALLKISENLDRDSADKK